MKYDNIIPAKFISRRNRFVAEVEIAGKTETVHVKNTGRCKELLLPGCKVWPTAPASEGRQTKYDLVAVRKSTGSLFNIDSQAPNKVVAEWLAKQSYDSVAAEYTYGDSRIDFFMQRGKEKYLMEVKDCTLEIDGVGYFPDAPTERGVKHLRELISAKAQGYNAAIAFVIQTQGVTEVRANTAIHTEFGKALDEAIKAGVKVLFFPCRVTPDSLEIIESIER